MKNLILQSIFATALFPLGLMSQNDSLDADMDLSSLKDFLDIEVVSASKGKDKLQTAPATIYVINEDEINNKGWGSLADALESLPGVEIQRKSEVEVFNNFSVRGIVGAEKFIVMVNGIRVNSATGTPHQIDYNFPVKNIKQIEVILGPGSALYGADAFTGVINIILKDYHGQTEASIGVDYGNFNTISSNFQVLSGKNDFSIQLLGSIYHSDEPFFPDYYADDFDWYSNEYSVNGNVGIPFDPNVVFPVGIEEYETPTNAGNIIGQVKYKKLEIGHCFNFASTNTSFGINPRYSIYSKDATRDFSINTTWIKHELKKEKWTLNSNLLYQDMKLLPQSSFNNFFSGYANGYKFSDDEVLKLEETFTYEFNESSNLIIGATAEHDYALANTSDLPVEYDLTKSPDEQNISYLGSNVEDKFGNDLSIDQVFYETIYQNYSAYAQFKKSFKDAYHLTLGSRYDYNSRYGSSINPRLGFVAAPNKKFQAKYLYGSAYLAPSPFKTFKHYGSFLLNSDSTGLESGFFHLPNPDLKPEKLQSHEINLNYLPSNNIQITANAFYNKITDLIVPELYFGESFQGAPVGAVQRNINKGLSETFGGTVSVLAFINIGSKSTLTPRIHYTYIDGHIEGEGLLYTAKNTIKANLNFSSGKFNTNLSMAYRDKSKAIVNGNELFNESFYVLNLAANYNLLEKKSYTLRLNMRVNNLLDARYYHLPKDNDLITLSNIPQDPIRFMIGMNLSFL